MSVLEALARLTAGPMRCDDDVYRATREPGLDAAAIDAVAQRLGAPLPADVRLVLGAARGIEGLEWAIDFSGELSFGMEEVFPHPLPIAADHQGNFWVVDCLAEAEPEAAIFFACHDPPVILWQCRGVAAFLHELTRSHEGNGESLLDDVHDDRLHDVWGTNAGAMTQRAALESQDEALRAFAASLTDDWSIIDLRAATPGMGFSWGRCGYPTGLRRYGEERLFACAAPKRRTGILSRLFGR